MKFSKGHNFQNYTGGVTGLLLCILSDDALYLYQVLWKYLKGF